MIALVIAAIENETDRGFIERLYAKNYALMYQKALSILKNPQRAEDAVEVHFHFRQEKARARFR